MAELFGIFAIILVLVALASFMNLLMTPPKRQEEPCNALGERHKWQYKSIEFPNGEVVYYVQCDVCGVRPGRF